MSWAQISNYLNKPHFFFRPTQAVRRLLRKRTESQSVPAPVQAVLPWGLPIRVNPAEYMASEILNTGVYDLCDTEVLWRLLDPGETAIDAGANIGQMTSIMALRVAKQGKVISFEPHPQVFQDLVEHAALWQIVPEIGKIEIHEMGLSKEAGTADLHIPPDFQLNRGTSSLNVHPDEAGTTVSIAIGRLADVVSPLEAIGGMKIDVEGHELSLLQGASDLLAERRIRDIVFEERDLYPSPVTDYLEQMGYTILSISQGHLGIRVFPAQDAPSHYAYASPSYLATLDAPRAIKRLRTPGYQVLRNQRTDRKSNLVPGVAAGVLLLLVGWFFARRKR